MRRAPAMELETERLLLREYVPEDWRAVLAYMLKPGYDEHYEAQERDEAYARDFIGWFVRWQGEAPRRRWQMAVTLKGAPDVVIGSCGLRLGVIEEHIDLVTPVREAVLGYDLDPSHWRHGYATEAANGVLRFGFETLDLHRVWSYHVAENERSAAVLRRLGFTREGRLRENDWQRGAWHDTVVYGLLRSEWQQSSRDGS
jgi:RimJ/RimL family protein N-acetyltransferase